MKKLIKNYFSEDPVSAILALVIFMCAVIMITSHIFLGLLTVGSFILELMLGFAAYGLVWAVYAENKHDAKLKKSSE